MSACLLVYLAPEKNMRDFASHSSVWNAHLLWPGKIVAQASLGACLSPFSDSGSCTDVPGSPTFTQGWTPRGRPSRRELLDLSIQRSHHLDIRSPCLFDFLYLSSPSSLRRGPSLIVVSIATRSKAWLGETLNKYEARLAIRMLWALLRLSYNISIKKWQGLKDHKWQKQQPRVASVRAGVSLCDSYPGSI